MSMTTSISSLTTRPPPGSWSCQETPNSWRSTLVVDLALEAGAQTGIPVEVEPAVDVLEQATPPGDHHVACPEANLRVAGLEDPDRHQSTLDGPMTNATSST
jgi:hypothetical protein